MLLKLLAFCVLHAFCADSTTPDSTTDDSGSEGARGYSANVVVPVVTHAIPTGWYQSVKDLCQRRHSEIPLPDGKRVMLTDIPSLRDQITISVPPLGGGSGMMVCHIPHLAIRTKGEIFFLSVDNNADSFAQRRNVYGSVVYQKEDSETGMLVVKPPREEPRAVWFSSLGSQPQNFYEFGAWEDSLCVTRFLVQYRDSQFFVRIEIPYANAREIAVTWGKRVNSTDIIVDEPVIFDFLKEPQYNVLS